VNRAGPAADRLFEAGFSEQEIRTIAVDTSGFVAAVPAK